MNSVIDAQRFQRRRRHCVLIRTGPKALHLDWTFPEQRGWDFINLVYDPALWDAASNGKRIVPGDWIVDGRAQPSKYTGILAFLHAHPEALGYESVMLTDDDILYDPADLDRLFALFKQSGADLGQPALTWDSYVALYLTYRNKAFLYRHTNYAEAMTPLMTGETLRELMWTFDVNKTHWGMDFLWTQHCAERGKRVVVIDGAPVTHTRPVGGGDMYKHLKADPGEEMAALFRKYRMKRPRLKVFGGVLDPAFGKPCSGLLIESYLKGLSREVRQRKGFSNLFKASLPYLLRRAR
jgi:hypothetical protein